MRYKPLHLPAPLVDAWQWQLDARCRSAAAVEVFDSEEPAAVTAAKRLCRECPVLQRCRDHALVANEPHGVWGALTPRERAHYRWTHAPVSDELHRYRMADTTS